MLRAARRLFHWRRRNDPVGVGPTKVSAFPITSTRVLNGKEAQLRRSSVPWFRSDFGFFPFVGPLWQLQ